MSQEGASFWTLWRATRSWVTLAKPLTSPCPPLFQVLKTGVFSYDSKAPFNPKFQDILLGYTCAPQNSSPGPTTQIHTL